MNRIQREKLRKKNKTPKDIDMQERGNFTENYNMKQKYPKEKRKIF